MNTTWSFSSASSKVNLLPQVIVDKLAAIDPSSDLRFLPWLKKSFIQKPFDLKPDFTMVINAVLRYIMSVPKKHAIELPERVHLETWLVQMQLLEHKKFKGIPALKVMQPKGMNEIPLPLRKQIEEQESWTKLLIKEMYAGTCYVLTVEPKRWVLLLLKQHLILNDKLEVMEPMAFSEQWISDMETRSENLSNYLKNSKLKFISSYIRHAYQLIELEMYYDDFLNGHTLDYLAQDQVIVVHYFQSLQKYRRQRKVA